MSLQIFCVEATPNTGVYMFMDSYYDQYANECLAGFVASVTAEFDQANSTNLSPSSCLNFDGLYFVEGSTPSNGTCSTAFALLDPSTFSTLQTSHAQAGSPSFTYQTVESSQTMPTPSEIVASFGAGFFVVLPILLTIFGGRMVLKSLFLSK